MSDDTNNTQADGLNQSVGEPVYVEEVKVSGESVVSKVKEIIREGTARRIAIKNEEGKTVLEIPLFAGAAVIFPPVATLAALGAVGALIANLTITVERSENEVKVDTTEDPEAT